MKKKRKKIKKIFLTRPEKLKIKTEDQVFIKNPTIPVKLEKLSKPLAQKVVTNI